MRSFDEEGSLGLSVGEGSERCSSNAARAGLVDAGFGAGRSWVMKACCLLYRIGGACKLAEVGNTRSKDERERGGDGAYPLIARPDIYDFGLGARGSF